MKRSERRRRITQRAFTLIELMVVVAIIGVLAALAVPSFMKYVKRAKTAEARGQLEKIYNGARSYFYETTETGQGGVISIVQSQFPNDAVTTPAGTCCATGGTRCEPNLTIWEADATWRALKFNMGDPHYFQYGFDSTGVGIGSEFTASAFGDLDCDGQLSTFNMFGFINTSQGEPTLTATQSRINELE